jgi:hypothetical protein
MMNQSDTAIPSTITGAALPIQLPTGADGVSMENAHHKSATLLTAARSAVSFPVLMAVLLVGTALIGVRLRLPDPDTWWHIAVGENILKTHSWPTSDPYSFTAPGTHWIAYEWLGEVAMALAARVPGLVGLSSLLIGLVGVVVVLLYYYAYLRCGNWKAACVATGLSIPIATAIFSLRPQLFGYIFLLVTLICLERFRQGHSKALWLLPPLFLVWANTHGTFVFGLAAIAVYFASGLMNFQLGGLRAEAWTKTQRIQLLFTSLLSVLAILVTPYGSQIAAYPALMATTQPLNIANIQEWQPLSFGLAVGKYLLALVLLVFLAHVFFPVKHRLQELVLLLFGVYAACVHIRFVLIFVMMFVPILASLLAKWMPSYERSKDKYALNVVVIALLILALVRFMPGKAELAEVVAKDYPVGALQYLREHPQPTGMFNEYGYGGYLIWKLGPEHKVFIDGRADIYEYSGVFQDYMHIANLDREALSLLAKYNIQSCLIGRKGALATLLAASPDWKQTYSDDLSVIFVRSRPSGAAGN